MRIPGIVFALTTFLAEAGVVDRIAVVVGNQVITGTEVEEEVRVTEFQNQERLDLSPEKRREAAERLVDQQLIRNEMQLNGHQAPPPSEADAVLADFRRNTFPFDSVFETALQKYGITRDELKQHLLLQAAVVRFVDFRFAAAALAASPTVQTANRLRAGASSKAAPSETPQLEAWLKDTRAQTRIEFKTEAFQ